MIGGGVGLRILADLAIHSFGSNSSFTGDRVISSTVSSKLVPSETSVVALQSTSDSSST